MFGNRNLGYFEISEKAFAHLGIVKEILSQVVVIRAEFHFDDRCMHYFCIGPFEDVEPGIVAPHYNVTCQDYLEEKPLFFQLGAKTINTNWLERKLYTCLTCYDEQTITCPKCNGSGEGMADGSKCLICKNGTVRCPDCGMEEL